MNLLRLGVAEICEEGAAPHGVVNAAVEIARAGRKTAGMAGLVNAVLRKVAGDAAKWPTLPVPPVAAKVSVSAGRSSSVAATVPTTVPIGLSSSTENGPDAVKTGVSFTSIRSMVTVTGTE